MVQTFLDHLKFEKRYSEHTIVAYKKDLSQFFDYVLAIYSLTEPDQVLQIHIRSWMSELVTGGISTRTINRKLSSLRSYYNFLRKRGYLKNNPTLKIIPPKVQSRLPSFIQEKKIASLFQDKDLPQDYHAFRDILIVELIYCTGIRRSELIGLSLSHIYLKELQIKVLGKGNKERLLPISKSLGAKIGLFLEVRLQFFEEMDCDLNLFLTQKGKKMYPRLVYNIVSSQIKKISTNTKRSPHTLRHSFATHMMNNGADLNIVKELLGHASLSATQIYTHNSIEKLKEVYKRTHPKGNEEI